MKIISKKGIELDIIVSGFAGRFDSKIQVSFNAGGKIVKNETCTIVRNGKIIEGISIPRLNGYVECEVSEIEKAVENLPVKPVKIKMYRLVSKAIDADGDIVKVSVWEKDGMEVGRFMSDFLNSLNVTEIEVSVADVQYEAQRTVRKSTTKVENIIFDNESEGVPAGNGIWE
jgi:hypothetical protein